MHILVLGADKSLSGPLEKHLTQWGHTVVVLTDFQRAMESIETTRIDIVIVAQRLPDEETVDFCRQVKAVRAEHHPYLLLADRVASPELADRLLDSGLNDVITPPLDPAVLRMKVAGAAHQHALEQDLNRRMVAIRRNYYQSVQTLGQLIDTYSDGVGAHCRRVGQLALSLAKRHPKVGAEDYPVIEAAGLLHDIGMIGLPHPVLKKRRTELAGNEGVLYRSHCERGEAILGQMDLLRPVARLVRAHHEQYNGRGFPDGLKDGQIPIGAAIIAAATLYDDLVHREHTDPKRIPEQLQRCRGYQVRPDLVELLLQANLELMQQENQRLDRMVYMDDLQAGMVLTREVQMKGGAFCMAAHTPLCNDTIEKLKNYYEMGNITNKVFVKK